MPEAARLLSVAIGRTCVCEGRSEGMNQHHVITGRIGRHFELAGRFTWVGRKTSEAIALLPDA
jgi:hypothetical protein